MTKTFCDHCGAEIDPLKSTRFYSGTQTILVTYSATGQEFPDFCRTCLGYATASGELPPLAVPE